MGFLIAIAAAGALLVRWLLGGPIARVLVFLLFAGLGILMGQTGADQSAPIIIAVLGWFISGIPTYIWRRGYASAGEETR